MGIHDIENYEPAPAIPPPDRPHPLPVRRRLDGTGDSPCRWKGRSSAIPNLKGVAAFSDETSATPSKGTCSPTTTPASSAASRGRKSTVGLAWWCHQHPQLHYDSHTIYDADGPGRPALTQTITYFSCHDNNTLWDRLALSRCLHGGKIQMQSWRAPLC